MKVASSSLRHSIIKSCFKHDGKKKLFKYRNQNTAVTLYEKTLKIHTIPQAYPCLGRRNIGK